MKLGNFIYKKKQCYGFYMTTDAEGFDNLKEAREHTRILDNKVIKYLIQDEDGNTLKTKIIY